MYCVICKAARDENVAADVVDRIKFELDGVGSHESVHSCPTCGYTWLFPKISRPTLDAYYADQHRWPSESVAYREQMEFMRPYIHKDQKVRVLDIGAYDGRLLNLFKEKGATETYAVEPDMSVDLNHNRFQTLGDAVTTLGPGSVDIVTMGHVFEHLQQPLIVLEYVKNLLVPGGLLMIEVPDLEDPQVQMVPYWTPFHQSYFTPTTLGYMLEVAGYTVQARQITGYRSVRIVARNFTNRTPNWEQAPPPQGAKAGVAEYLKKRKKLLGRIKDRLFTVYPDNLAVFGTGNHTDWLLAEYPDMLLFVSTFLSSDPECWGTFMDRPVVHPNKCPDDVDTIICSSYDSQDEMAQAVGKRALMLYEDVRAYDVWMGVDNEV